jgi:DNA-binding XRE family transcriptional regulator
MFAEMLPGYLACSDEVQAVIQGMVKIVNSDDASTDEREAALETIAEALFPSKHSGELGVDVELCEEGESDEVKAMLSEMNAEEASFAERLQATMDARDMTQGDLAKAIGVGQSAISMMLSRNCRPQRKTVEKIAGALKVPVEDMWPGIKHR